MYDKGKVTDLLLAEVGYREKATNDQLDDPIANSGSGNYTKFARDLAAVSYYNTSKRGADWCAVFVNWGMFKAFGKDAALALACQPYVDNCGAGCGYAFDYYKRKGQMFFSNPQEGDQIFFWSSDHKTKAHTGYVYAVDAERVYTVEGNVSGQVKKKQYMLHDPDIAGYGRPKWSQSATPVVDVHETIRNGARSAAVVMMQGLLIKHGYSIVADGIFGGKTEAAVKAFQLANGLDDDGVCGPLTWAALRDGVTDTEMDSDSMGGMTDWNSMTLEEKVEDLHRWRISMMGGGVVNGS